jgi:hypothetical protein
MRDGIVIATGQVSDNSVLTIFQQQSAAHAAARLGFAFLSILSPPTA